LPYEDFRPSNDEFAPAFMVILRRPRHSEERYQSTDMAWCRGASPMARCRGIGWPVRTQRRAKLLFPYPLRPQTTRYRNGKLGPDDCLIAQSCSQPDASLETATSTSSIMNFVPPIHAPVPLALREGEARCDMRGMRFHLEERTRRTSPDGLPSDEAALCGARRFGTWRASRNR